MTVPGSKMSDSRAKVVSAIQTSAQPMTVEQISQATGLHANTVRGHLEVLLASDVITRSMEASLSRGRPHWLYEIASTKPSPYQFLAEALSVQLTQARNADLAQEVAEQWARVLPDSITAESPDAAVTDAAAALVELGFTAQISPVGDAIALTQCPYADLVKDNPLICDIHASLVSKLLKKTGQPVFLETMDVWARPGTCVAHLNRPDVTPARVIELGPDGPVDFDQQSTTKG